MKKIISLSLSLCMIFSMLTLSGCGKKNPDDFTTTFTTEFEWTNDLKNAYLEQDAYQEMTYAGPFYFGNFDGINQYTRDYSEYRADQVDEIIDFMDEGVNYLYELDEELKKERALLDWYYLQIAAQEPSAGETLFELLDETNELALINKYKLEYLLVLVEDLEKMERNAEWGFMQYAKMSTLILAAESYTQEIQDLNNKFLALYYQAEGDENPIYQMINQKLDESLEPLSIKVDEALQKVYFSTSSLLLAEKVLFTADYHFARDVTVYLDRDLVKMGDAIRNYDGSKKAVTEETIAYLEAQKQLLYEYNVALKQKLDSIPADQLMSEEFLASLPSYDLFLPTAHAGFLTPFKVLGNGVQYVLSGQAIKDAGAKANVAIRATGNAVIGTTRMAWSTTKTVAGAVKDVAIGGVKKIGTVIGTTLDTADAVTKSGVDLAQGLYYWEDGSKVWSSVKKNFGQVVDNFQKGKSGSVIYKDAVSIMKNVDSTVADWAKIIPDKILGKGSMVSTGVGYLAKTASGFFTGLAKDSFAALDPTVSEAKTLESMAGLALTCIGGSQQLFSGSQGLNVGKNATTSALSTFKNFITGANTKNFSNFFKGGMKQAFTKTFSRQTLQTLGNKTLSTIQKSFSNMGNGLKNGWRYLKTDAAKNISTAFKTFTTQSFKKNATGFMKAFKNVLGMDDKGAINKLKGFFNNVVGNEVDNKIKQLVSWFGVSDKNIDKLPPEQQAEMRELKAKLEESLKLLAEEEEPEFEDDEEEEEEPEFEDDEGVAEEEEPEFEDDEEEEEEPEFEDDEGVAEEEEPEFEDDEGMEDQKATTPTEPEPVSAAEPATDGMPTGMPQACYDMANEINRLLPIAGQGNANAGIRIQQLAQQYLSTPGCEDFEADTSFMGF